MQGGKRNIIGTTSNPQQQQLLQQMHKQSSHHFVGSAGPSSSHGQNQYANSNEFLIESQKIIYAPPSRENKKHSNYWL